MTGRRRREPGGHMYVDESTASEYLVVCAVISSRDVRPARVAMKALLLPGQRGLHMKNERNRATEILGAVIDLRPWILLCRVPRGVPEMEARRRCVRRLSQEACELGVSRIVLDRIDSVVERDRSWLIAGAQEAGCHAPPFAYLHQRRHEEPLLWIADAVAWAWSRGGHHRLMIRPLVSVVDL